MNDHTENFRGKKLAIPRTFWPDGFSGSTSPSNVPLKRPIPQYSNRHKFVYATDKRIKPSLLKLTCLIVSKNLKSDAFAKQFAATSQDQSNSTHVFHTKTASLLYVQWK